MGPVRRFLWGVSRAGGSAAWWCGGSGADNNSGIFFPAIWCVPHQQVQTENDSTRAMPHRTEVRIKAREVARSREARMSGEARCKRML